MMVAHVPSVHPYVGSVDPDAVALDDPWSVGEIVRSGVHAVHVHFGFEHLSAAALTTWINQLHAAGVAIVHTVHDIDNPHLVDQSEHHRRTAALVRRAEVVTTLTQSAADEIECRWGRRTVVIPHPSLVDPAVVTGVRSARRGRHALLWLGTLRPNIDIDAVAEFVRAPSCEVVVAARHDAWSRCAHGLRCTLERADRMRAIALQVMPRPSDRRLAETIASAGVLVLPYAWGTHSGLVELATDLGVPTVTPIGGSRHDQGAVTCERLELMATATDAISRPSVSVRGTSRSIDAVRHAHRDLYATLPVGAPQAS